MKASDHHLHDGDEPRPTHSEHPEPLVPEPLVPTNVLQDIRRQLSISRSMRQEAHERVLAEIEAALETLDWLAAQARGVVFGDPAAKRSFRFWLEEAARSGAAIVSHAAPQPGSIDHPKPHAHGVAAEYPRGVVNIGPLGDIFLGVGFLHHANEHAYETATKLLRGHIAETLFPVALLGEASRQSDLDGGRPLPDPLRVLLDHYARLGSRPWTGDTGDFPGFGDILPEFPIEMDFCISEMAALGAPKGGPLASGVEYRAEQANNSRIVSVSPNPVCTGNDLILRAAPAMPFDAVPPQGILVVFGNCHAVTPVAADDWLPTRVRVAIPDEAVDGPVFFVLPQAYEHGEDPAAEWGARLQSILESCPLLAPGTALGSFTTAIVSKGLHFLPLCVPFTFPDKRNEISVKRRATIVSFQALDASGTVISDTHPAPARSQVTLRWRVTPDPKQATQLRLLPAPPGSGTLALDGFFTFRTDHDETYVLEAINGCGTARSSVAIEVFRALKFVRPFLVAPLDGETATVIERPFADEPDTVVNVSSSVPDKLEVLTPSVTIPQGSQFAVVRVHGKVAGWPSEPGQPARAVAVITASAARHRNAESEVWVEPTAGEWRGAGALGMVGIHAALLRTGKVLFFSGDENAVDKIDAAQCEIWDPVTRTSALVTFPKPRNLFCSGQCFLPDGRLLVAGGHVSPMRAFTGHGADKDIHTFDPGTNTWSRHADMACARWYPTCTALPDGRALIVSGSANGAPPGISTWFGIPINKAPDLFSPDTNGLTSLATSFVTDWEFDMYPHVLVLPGGVVFTLSHRSAWLHYPSNTSSEPLGRELSPHVYRTQSSAWRTYPVQTGCVLLPLTPAKPGTARVLVAGGNEYAFFALAQHHRFEDVRATNSVEIFEYDATGDLATRQRGFRTTRSMRHARFMADAVLLPDATVLIVGGVAAGKADVNFDPVLIAECFDPATETWRDMAPMTVERRYHSTALLLADGRVLSAGSTGNWQPHTVVMEHRLELFYPPYLFRGPRPHVSNSPASIGYNQSFTVGVAFTAEDARFLGGGATDEIRKVALVRPGAVTHSNNMDQRYVELDVLEASPDELVVRAPRDANFAPPGYYMLFVVGNGDIPSEGRFLQLA